MVRRRSLERAAGYSDDCQGHYDGLYAARALRHYEKNRRLFRRPLLCARPYLRSTPSHARTRGGGHPGIPPAESDRAFRRDGFVPGREAARAPTETPVDRRYPWDRALLGGRFGEKSTDEGAGQFVCGQG